jgi:hypothetical protein
MSVSQRFFGYNAKADSLGLKSGPVRERLKTFYKNNGIDTPPKWMTKL